MPSKGIFAKMPFEESIKNMIGRTIRADSLLIKASKKEMPANAFLFLSEKQIVSSDHKNAHNSALPTIEVTASVWIGCSKNRINDKKASCFDLNKYLTNQNTRKEFRAWITMLTTWKLTACAEPVERGEEPVECGDEPKIRWFKEYETIVSGR